MINDINLLKKEVKLVNLENSFFNKFYSLSLPKSVYWMRLNKNYIISVKSDINGLILTKPLYDTITHICDNEKTINLFKKEIKEISKIYNIRLNE